MLCLEGIRPVGKLRNDAVLPAEAILYRMR
jgi:hypothetical protein